MKSAWQTAAVVAVLAAVPLVVQSNAALNFLVVTLMIALAGQGVDAAQELLAPVVAEPHHLKRVVALDAAVGVVVNRLAGARKQSRRRVLVAEDQRRVGLAALQGDAHRHLVDGAARQGIRAAQGLRAEQYVQAERPTLSYEPVKEQGRLLRHAIVFHKELLKLINNQHDPWQRAVAGVAVAADVEDSERLERSDEDDLPRPEGVFARDVLEDGHGEVIARLLGVQALDGELQRTLGLGWSREERLQHLAAGRRRAWLTSRSRPRGSSP